ncbi:MAG: FHA domain-containing protein [Paracoccaceae bacterium]
MRMIKDIIVRRRPPVDLASEVVDTDAQDQATLKAVASESPKAEPEIDAEDVPSRDFRDHDLSRAVQARDFVPTHEVPPCRDQPDWNKPEDKANSQHSNNSRPERVTSVPKIWDVQPESNLPPPTASAPPVGYHATEQKRMAEPETDDDAPISRVKRRVSSERVKTRLLGFHAEEENTDIFAASATKADGNDPCFPIGWLVVTDGPGRGASFTLTSGLSTIGRDMNQTVALDFGDTSISRERHVSVAYDDEENRAYVGHGGKSNIVRHNNKPLLTTEELAHGDTIKIGKTQLNFVAFCTPDFSWTGLSGEQPDGYQDV